MECYNRLRRQFGCVFREKTAGELIASQDNCGLTHIPRAVDSRLLCMQPHRFAQRQHGFDIQRLGSEGAVETKSIENSINLGLA